MFTVARFASVQLCLYWLGLPWHCGRSQCRTVGHYCRYFLFLSTLSCRVGVPVHQHLRVIYIFTKWTAVCAAVVLAMTTPSAWAQEPLAMAALAATELVVKFYWNWCGYSKSDVKQTSVKCKTAVTTNDGNTTNLWVCVRAYVCMYICVYA